MENKKLKLIIDHREVPSGLVDELRLLDVEIDLQQLAVGDFVVSQRVGVERKSTSDFLQSLIDGRLLEQTKVLRETFERPVLILEGGEFYGKRDIHPNAIRGALASIAVDLGVPIVPTKDEQDTALFLATLARREQVQEFKEVALRRKLNGLSTAENQRFIVEGLPGVSAVLAKRLLEHFKTVSTVMCAPEKELQEVNGIGKLKARAIHDILTAQYEEEVEK